MELCAYDQNVTELPRASSSCYAVRVEYRCELHENGKDLVDITLDFPPFPGLLINLAQVRPPLALLGGCVTWEVTAVAVAIDSSFRRSEKLSIAVKRIGGGARGG